VGKYDVIQKPELRNASRRQRLRMTEPRSQETDSGNLAKFGHVVREICEQADRQTDRHAHRNTALPYGTGENISWLVAGERGYSEKSGSAAAVDKQQAKLMSSGSIARWIAVNYRRVVGLAI